MRWLAWRRRQLLPKLIAQRDALDRQIAELQGVEAPIVATPAPARPAGKRRGRTPRVRRGEASLVGMLTEILKGKKAVSISEAVDALTSSGYKSKSKNFRGIVSMALAKDKRFKRAGRGEYALKG